MKKKVSLVDKESTIIEALSYLKLLLIKFPLHRYNNTKHTKNQVEELKQNMTGTEIVEFQDFSENYTCLLPREIQSLH